MKKMKGIDKKLRGNSKELRLYKENLKPLTEEQKEILIGLALGDMNIRKPSQAKHALISPIWVPPSGKNMEYGYHVYNLFKEYFLSEPIVYNRKNINGNLVCLNIVLFHKTMFRKL